MKVIKHPISQVLTEWEQEIFTTDAFFMDIETTGFNADYQSCYLIGCMFRTQQGLEIHQFFAQTPEDEPLILKAFLETISPYKKIITFNGDMFDIPFLKKRFEKHHMAFHTEFFHSIDLLKHAKKLKKTLGLPNCKQKTLESFFKIQREDTYSGGELIDVYHAYSKDQNPEKEALLLLHNLEDVHYMLPLLQIFPYEKIHQNLQIDHIIWENSGTEEIYFHGHTNLKIPTRIQKMSTELFYQLEKDTIQGALHVKPATLKYFYKNYKDYNYIIEEQIIIPKMLSSSMDTSRKRAAKKEECYTTKDGHYLLAISYKEHPDFYGDIRLFREDYKSKDQYFLYDPAVIDPQWLTSYLHLLMKSL